ncbi:MAG: hypothetical protein N3D84_02825 [Candidatus Woesearchaeota archaeon]|nr:hypothetical protein [Candidatus Woesearchaeota archaeon]
MAEEKVKEKEMDGVLEKLSKWKRPLNKEIADALGKSAARYFSYSYNAMEGKKRKDCDNPAIAHSYDVALRIKNFLKENGEGISRKTIKKSVNVGLLHDILEEKAEFLEDVDGMHSEIKERFSAWMANESLLLTDLTSIVINHISNEIGNKNDLEEFTQRLKKYSKECAILDRYSTVFSGIERVAKNVKLKDLEKMREEFYNLNFVDIIKFRCYEQYYIRKIASIVAERWNKDDQKYVIPFIVKIMDGVDNVRTMPPTKAYEAEKIIKKTEIKIDVFSEMLKKKLKNKEEAKLIKSGINYLKGQLIEQIERRIDSLSHLNDTRYAGVEEFYRKAFERLKKKYASPKVPTGPK